MDMFNRCSIEIKHIITNEQKLLYKIKLHEHTLKEDIHKIHKYESKLNLSVDNVTRNSSLPIEMIGGAQIPLIKDIAPDICDGMPNMKPKSVIEVYSEPLTSVLFEMLEQICAIQLKIYINAHEFIYIPGSSGVQFYYPQCIQPMQYDVFKDIYEHLFDELDNYARSQGIDTSPFSDAYNLHFTQKTFENNTWKNRMMFNHLVKHKYAHNGIGGAEIKDVVDIIELLNLGSDNKDTWSGLHFIHSITHIYDDIYMQEHMSPSFDDDIQLLNRIKTDMFEPNVRQYDCVRRIVNKYRSDFLEKTGTEYDLPYKIKQEAIDDKIRQYNRTPFFSKASHNFHLQLMKNSYTKIGETPKTIHEDEV
jgi:hypothetical protein